ncbi:MAG: response regulator transcription factor [Bacteroidales bacterium]|nr:response regulator transcription factor [Bacteroidales bacterium]
MNSVQILIVDDHQIMIDGIRSMLEGNTSITIAGEANNGLQALEFLSNHPVDVVLMDVEMPVMNGIDASVKIKDLYPQTKILALTTYDEKSIINAMLDVGVNGYILKNINRAVLVNAIETVATGKTYLGSDVKIAMVRNKSIEAKVNTITEELPKENLSDREMEVLKAIVNGLSNKEIANTLFISPKTVETHRNNIMKKLEVHNTASLVKVAIKSGLIR